MSLPNLYDLIIGEDEQEAKARRANGVAVGIVTNNKDPERLGRVKLHFPWLSDDNETDWIRIATLMAGAERGSFFLPDVEDEVLVAFEFGDINRPFVIGALWNKEDASPEINSDGKNNLKKVKTRSGHELIWDDTSGNERVELHSKGGHQILLSDATGSEKLVIKDGTGQNSIEFNSVTGSIAISSSTKISLHSSMIDIAASGTMNIQAPVITIQAAGTLTCQASAIMNQGTATVTCAAGGPLVLKGMPIAMG